MEEVGVTPVGPDRNARGFQLIVRLDETVENMVQPSGKYYDNNDVGNQAFLRDLSGKPAALVS